jgi:hypothetical protein
MGVKMQTWNEFYGDTNGNIRLTITKMNPEVKVKWLQALRSGNYTQGTGALCSVQSTPVFLGEDDGEDELELPDHYEIDSMAYCCLGVISDVMHAGWDFDAAELNGHDKLYNIFGAEDLLSPNESVEYGITSDVQDFLVNQNDSGATFQDIASWIEENL